MVGGMEAKYTGTVSLSIPFIVVAIRCRGRLRFRAFTALLFVCLLTALLISPLYIGRNYAQTKELFPINMSWNHERQLESAHAKRDADYIGFFAHAFRFPKEFFTELDAPIRDSFFHIVWLQTWKLEDNTVELLGPKSPLSGRISNVYFFLFFPLFLIGNLLFFTRVRKHTDALHDFGKILFAIALIFILAQTSLFFSFPLWRYEVMKAKYIAPALLWILFASAYCIYFALQLKVLERFRPYVTYGSLGLVLLYVIFNHVVPVY